MNSSDLSENTAPKKHILFINYYFPPMGGGGVQRIVKFLKYFDYTKYDVSVLTVKDSYFYSSDDSLLAEIPAPVKIVRSGSLDPFRLIHLMHKIKNLFSPSSLPPANSVNYKESSGRIRKIAMSVFVPDSRLLWLPFAIIKLWQLHQVHRIDLVVSSLPPFTAGLIAALFKQWMKVPFILDFRDAWTNNAYMPGMGRFHTRLNERMESYCLSRSAAVVFVNPALESFYRRRHNSRLPAKISTIRNGYDPDDFKGISIKTESKTATPFTLGIMGTIYSQGNRPLTLLNAIENMLKDNPALSSQFKLVLMGKWSPDFIETVSKLDLKEIVEWQPYLPHREALKKAAEFDALTLSIEDGSPGSEMVTPGRIYEHIRLKKPVLAICPPESDLAWLVKHHRAGEVVAYKDVEGIKAVLLDWIAHSGNMAEKYQFVRFRQISRKSLTAELINFLSSF
ncbi:MAG: glycosyltransferase family 4 protein [Calditrichia bacterium]